MRLAVLLTALSTLGAAAPAQAAFDDPLFVFTPIPENQTPPPKPPPVGYFEGPCGLAVDSAGRFYVSDYYHDAVDVFAPSTNYVGQLTPIDPIDGPCGLALNGSDNLYVNDYHRKVISYGPLGSFGAGTTIDSSHPTGVAVDPATDNVYVDARTHVAAYDPSGAPLLDGGGEPLLIGEGTLEDGYGLAVSGFAATAGRIYVPDAETDTVKIYDPATSVVNPVQTIAGPPGGGFVSLHDSAVAVDDATGEAYVADTLGPQFTERPQATIYVFDSAGAFKGRLKHSIVDASPPGLAVDNSGTATQSRVYVTTGNTERASVIAYPPGAATSNSAPPIGSAGFGATGAPPAEPDPPLAGASTQASARAAGDEAAAAPGAAKRKATPSARKGEEATIVQKGNLRVAMAGRLSPRRLPRRGVAPISVSIGGQITTTDGSLPPQLKRLRIELNRHGRLDNSGLPSCPYDRIQPASTSRALAACRASLVGKGSFTANITLGGQEPYPTEGEMLVFHSIRKGAPVLLGQIYSPRPFASSFVIVFAIETIRKGSYGTALTASLSRALGDWGNLTGIEMTLSRRYAHAGRRHSFASAGCPAPDGFSEALFPMARTSLGFAGGKTLVATLVRSCRVR